MTCANFRDRAEATRSLVYNKKELKKKKRNWLSDDKSFSFPMVGFFIHLALTALKDGHVARPKAISINGIATFEKGLLVDRWQVCWPHPRGLLRGKIIVYLTVHWGKREPQTSHSNRNPTSRTDSRWKDNTRSRIWHFFYPFDSSLSRVASVYPERP